MKANAIAAVMLTLLATSAHAQENKRPVTARTDEQKAEDEASERAYQNAIKGTRTKDQGASAKVDPWSNVRPAAANTPKH